MKRHRHRGLPAIAALVSAIAVVAACTPSTPGGTADASSHAAGATKQGLPATHVHGVGRDPGDGSLLLATHEGLFRYGPEGPQRVGPIIDLMGFTVAGPGHYYASGHPNAVLDLPQPLGLVETTDAGRTWSVLSRGGESDFHTLTQAGDTLLAFDNQLRRTKDRRSWTTGSLPAEPRTLAADPDGRTTLATTENGLMKSEDQAATWNTVEAAPTLLLVAWASNDTAAGVTPDGAVAISNDGATTWRMTGATVPSPQALSASMTSSGLEIVVVTEDEVLGSTDGTTFVTITQ